MDKKGDTKFGSMASLQFGALTLALWHNEKEFDETENESCLQKVKLIKGFKNVSCEKLASKGFKNVLKCFMWDLKMS